VSFVLLWDSKGGLVAFYYNYRQVDLIWILSKVGIYGSYRHLFDVGVFCWLAITVVKDYSPVLVIDSRVMFFEL
jgi:hypothetical protein